MKKISTLLLLLMGLTEMATAQTYTCGFETAEECKGWTFINGSQPEYWMIGTGAAATGSKALYVTNNGSTNTAPGKSSETYAYKKFHLTSGSHTLSMAWRNGVSSYAYLTLYVVPATSTLPQAGGTTSFTTTYANTYIRSKSAWTSANINLNTTDAGDVYIVFQWGNYKGSGTAGAVDDIILTNAYDADYTDVVTEGDFLFAARGNDAYSILSYLGTAEELTLPTTCNGKPVTAIERGAFYNRTYLKELTIPAGYDSIAAGAFNGCNQLNFVDKYGIQVDSVAGTIFSNNPIIFVDDTTAYKNAWPGHSSNIYLRSLSDREVTITARTNESALHRAIGDAYLRQVVRL